MRARGTANENRPFAAAHLVLQEHVVGRADDLLHVDDGAHAGDVHLGQHGEHQDGLHQQLPVLGLGDAVQHRLHVDGELDLSRRHLQQEKQSLEVKTSAWETSRPHLSGGGRREDEAFDGQAVTLRDEKRGQE